MTKEFDQMKEILQSSTHCAKLCDAFELEGEPGTLFEASELCAADSPTAGEMVALHAQSRGLPVNRFSGSLVFQRYSHRICEVALHALLRGNCVLDLRAENCVMLFQNSTPTIVGLHNPQIVDVGDRTEAIDSILECVVDNHLFPLAHAVSRVSRAGMPNLWGNMAAGFAGVLRNLSKEFGTEEILEIARRIEEKDARLAKGGDYLVVRNEEAFPAKEMVQYTRKSCCHWYAAKDGQFCSWCSRLTAEERFEKFQDQLRR